MNNLTTNIQPQLLNVNTQCCLKIDNAGCSVLRMDKKRTNGQTVAERREALGWTQADLAERVRQLSGSTTFSQQSVDKLERPGSGSKYMHFVLQALEDAEAEVDAIDQAGPQPAQKPHEPAYIEQMRKAVMDAAQLATPSQLLSVMEMLINSGRSPDNRHSPPIDEILKVVEQQSLDQAEYQKTVTLLTESISEIGKKLNNVVQFIERRQEDKGAPKGKERRTIK